MNANVETRRPKDPFFIVGFSRSGSTLIRQILSVHPNLLVLEEPHGWLELPAAINSPARLRKTIHKHPRLRAAGLEELIKDTPPSPNPGDNIDSLFRALAEKNGKPGPNLRWGIDNPRDVYHLPRLLELFPEGRLILLLRDPRDIASSALKLAPSPKGYNFAASGRQWRERIELFRRSAASLPAEQCTILRYEDLVENPGPVLGRLCDFIGEPYEPRMLDYHLYAPDDVSHTKSDLYMKPISPASVGSWRTGIKNRKDLARLETQARSTMEDYGYEPETLESEFQFDKLPGLLYETGRKLRNFTALLTQGKFKSIIRRLRRFT